MLGYLFIRAWHQSSCEALIYCLPPTLFNLSLTANIVILAVLMARFFLRKAPRAISYALWAVVAFRLICPVSFSSSFSLLGAMDAPVAETGQVEYVPVDIVHNPYPSVDLIIPEVTEVVNEQLPSHESQIYGEFLEAPAELSTWIWLIGIGVMLLWTLSSYLNLRHKLRTAVLLEGNVFQSEHVGSPFILGLFRPKIYIPFGLDDSSLRYVLAHERYHIKRLDHIVKVLSFAILVIHWFNPLCWLAFHLMSKDMEMSCDEKVLSADNNSKTEYSTVLLSFAANRRFPSPSPLAFGETSAKSRIKNALKWKHPKVWVTILAVVLCIAVIIVCAANPTEDKSSETNDIEVELYHPYEWTSTVSHDDIYAVTAMLLNTDNPTFSELSSSQIHDLVTILNQIPADSVFTGRGSPAQLKLVINTGDRTMIMNYGSDFVDVSYPSFEAGPWEIHDAALNEYLAQWLTQLQQTNNNTNLEEISVSAEAVCEINPLLSYAYPAFPFRFNFPYTHIRAICTDGTLFAHDSNASPNTYGYRQSLKYTSGQTIYWDPFYNNSVSTSAVISFTVYDDETVLHTGNIQITQMQQETSSVGKYFYTASLTDCNNLILRQGDENYGGGWISEAIYIYDLTENGPITLSTSILSRYRFKTNSATLLVDFPGTKFPLSVHLYASDSEEPIQSFSCTSESLRSFSFSGFTSDENQEYYFIVDCPVDMDFTIRDGSGYIHPITSE